jgi:hypothetical protein
VVLDRCPLCAAGVGESRPLAQYEELTWVACRCGLIYKHAERPDPAAADFYEGGYFGEGEQGRRYTRRLGRRVQKSRNQILDLLNHAPPGRSSTSAAPWATPCAPRASWASPPRVRTSASSR